MSWLVVLVGCLTPHIGQASAPDAFAECASLFQTRPEEYESALCFYRVSAQTGRWPEASDRLRALAAEYPAVTWLRLARAHVEWSAGSDSAELLYRDTAEEFAAAGNQHGELVARSNLRALLFRTGRVREAEAEIARIIEIGEHTQDLELRVRALVDQSRHDIQMGSNLSRAQGVLQRAKSALDQTHPYWLRKEVLHSLGLLNLHFGQFEAAVEEFQQQADAAEASDDIAGLALARVNIANATFEMLTETPRTGGREEVLELAEAALETARRAHSDHVEVAAHRLLAELWISDEPKRAEVHLGRCRALAEALSEPGVLSECLWSQARLLAPRDREAAGRLIRTAVELMEEHQDMARLGHAWRHQMRISWQTLPLAEAVADGERALGVFESLRELQLDERGRTGVLAAWTRDYYWLSGGLLERAERDDDESLVGRAFLVTERMRARALLEAVQPNVADAVPTDAAVRDRQEVLGQIVELNRRMLLGPEDRARARILEELEALELRERELREALYRAHGRAPAAAFEPAILDDLRKALAPDEALLSFQIGAWQDVSHQFGGGAWLIVATRDAVRTVRLPGRTELTDSIAVALGLMRGEEVVGSVEIELYRRLFGEALEQLSDGVRRLIIVPDYPLHRFPLAALRQSLESEPLGVRYELAIVPSATLWRRWRGRTARSHGHGALVLANPRVIGSQHPQAAEWRSWAIGSGLVLGPLPHAETEGRRVLARLGQGSELLTGARASEAALKTSDLGAFGILHFATHAVVDQTHPERSAVMLAAGDEDEDGLLQVREIVDLPLDGQVVVLSACQSATGTHVRGEGVQGLARAFFAAGADAVVGSLWPMRDDHAEAFFEVFYDALAAGRTVGAAVHTAQRRLQSRGLPIEAWAGFQLLGEGGSVLVAAPVDRSHAGLWLGILGLVAVAGAAWIPLARRFAKRPSAVR